MMIDYDKIRREHAEMRKLKEERIAWINSLKPGDQVAFGNSWIRRIETVTRVTDGFVWVGNLGIRINRKDGRFWGAFSGSMPERVTPELLKQNKDRVAAAKHEEQRKVILRRVEKLTLKRLRELDAWLKEKHANRRLVSAQ